MTGGDEIFIGKVQQRIEKALWKAPKGSMPSSSLEEAAHRLLLSPDAKRARAGLVGQVGRMVGAKEDLDELFTAALELTLIALERL